MAIRWKTRATIFVGLLAVVSTLAVAGCVDLKPPQNDDNGNESTVVDSYVPDPESDQLGWEAGYWYNESISVRAEDGLNDSELDAVVARSMARVEQIRRLEFEETPPVEVISQESYAQRVANESSNMTEAQRLHQNVKFEALFMINESTDATKVQESNLAGSVMGFYDTTTGEIKIVSQNTSTPKMDEITLSQELFHALQGQKFNISWSEPSTRERHNALDNLLEGDGNYVDHLYRDHCENEWKGTCITPSGGQGSGDANPHLGLLQMSLQPYSTGPAFVRNIHQQEGWDGVNALYENPPTSTEQVIHPEKYGQDKPTNVTIRDRSSDAFDVLELNNSINYASFGEAGLYVMLWYPSYETTFSQEIIPFRDHVNDDQNDQIDEFEPYQYDHPYTAGWDGDKLLPYVTDDSFDTNETGYIYRTIWDSPEDVAQFREGYEQLLEIHGAETVDGRANTYRIPDEEPYGDAFYLNQTATTLEIVNAPTVEHLSDVQRGAAPPS